MSSFLVPEGLDRPYSTLDEDDSLSVGKKNLKPFFDFINKIVNG